MIKKTIDRIVDERSNGNADIAQSIRAKITLKGIDVDFYTENSPDDEAVMERLEEIAEGFGIILQ